jgi:hypothetical protein
MGAGLAQGGGQLYLEKRISTEPKNPYFKIWTYEERIVGKRIELFPDLFDDGKVTQRGSH